VIISIIGFLVCAVLITLSGTQLSKQGNRLAELTGLSKAWIGLILMATVTSLPELVTGLSSIVVVKAPDLAFGNVVGSCTFNLLILSLLDLMLKKPITSLVKTSHVVAGSFSIILLACVAVAVLLAPETPAILWFSPFSLLLLAIYLAAMRGIFLFEKSNVLTEGEERISDGGDKNGLKRVLSTYSIHALIVTIAALFLPYFGEKIAQQTGLSDSFFGTVFLAITTSLPELVVSVSALRMGSLDMAMGNLLGSNVFNVAILSVLDLFYTEGALYAEISATHSLSILAAIIMTAVVAVGLVTRPERKTWRLGMDTWVILIIYVLLLLILN
jgi:cation:H+ antiporter